MSHIMAPPQQHSDHPGRKRAVQRQHANNVVVCPPEAAAPLTSPPSCRPGW